VLAHTILERNLPTHINLQFSHPDWEDIFRSGLRQQSTRDVMEALRHAKISAERHGADVTMPMPPLDIPFVEIDQHPHAATDGRVLSAWFGIIRFRGRRKKALAEYLRACADRVESF
jgi:hypothetical protein